MNENRKTRVKILKATVPCYIGVTVEDQWLLDELSKDAKENCRSRSRQLEFIAKQHYGRIGLKKPAK